MPDLSVTGRLRSLARFTSPWSARFAWSELLKTNLAVHKPATQSSVSAQWSIGKTRDSDAGGANDGVVDGLQGCCTGKEPNPWWQVDLQAICSLRQLRLYNCRRLAGRLRHFRILTSLDGTNWIHLFSKFDDAAFGEKRLVPFVVQLPPQTVGRFLRVQLLGLDYLHFNELQVFGASLAPDAAAEATDRFNALLSKNDELAERAGVNAVQEGDDARQIVERAGVVAAQLTFMDAIRNYTAVVGHGPYFILVDQIGAIEQKYLSDCTLMTDRIEMLKHLRKGGRFVEVGTFRGEFAWHILNIIQPEELVLIDITFENFNFNRLSKHPLYSRVKQITGNSFDEIARLGNNSCDVIYIDANHMYEFVHQELEASRSKVKDGGYIIANDYTSWSTLNGHKHGVMNSRETRVRQLGWLYGRVSRPSGRSGTTTLR